MPGFFPLERWSELRVRADKDNVSHQLRTTNKKAEPMRRVPENDATENVCLPEETANSPSPGDESSDLPVKDTRQRGSLSTSSQVLWTWVYQSGSGGTLGSCGHAFGLRRASFQELKTLGH